MSSSHYTVDHLFLDRRLIPNDAVAAILLCADGRYLLQQRDDIPGIFYPGHWGLFGGGVEAGEDGDAALARELHEELRLTASDPRYFCRLEFDYVGSGQRVYYRRFYEIILDAEAISRLSLGEGRAMALFRPEDVLALPNLVPYDAFALWQHVNRSVLAKPVRSDPV